MSDEWSLKDKGMKGYPDGKPTGIYSQEVLETLRKKLIQDIKDERLDQEYCDMTDTLIAIINKRFGVKE